MRTGRGKRYRLDEIARGGGGGGSGRDGYGGRRELLKGAAMSCRSLKGVGCSEGEAVGG